jgi:vacuolar-type H+-ATPase subunit I/STV1
MPFALIIFGVLLAVVGIRNTQSQLGRLIVDDFTGPGNFFYWIVALLIIGLLGEIDELETPSRMFIVLLLLAMLLSNQGFFEKFVQGLKQGSAAPPPPGPPNPQPNTGSGGGSGGASPGGRASGPAGGAGNIIATAASVMGLFGL